MAEYPEHEKLLQVQDKSQAIGEFLDWLQNEEKVTLCKLGKPFGEDAITYYTPIHESIDWLLAKYFGIDLDLLSQEKAKMLERIRIKH